MITIIATKISLVWWSWERFTPVAGNVNAGGTPACQPGREERPESETGSLWSLARTPPANPLRSPRQGDARRCRPSPCPRTDCRPPFLPREGRGRVKKDIKSAKGMASSGEGMNGWKRRGSVTRDRRGRTAVRSTAVSRSPTSREATIRHWPVRHGGERTTRPPRAVGRRCRSGRARRIANRRP
jgi:hypothetical protein